MEIDQILDILLKQDKNQIKQALQNAILKKNEIIPHLIKNVEYVYNNYKNLDDNNNYMCFYSLLLLLLLLLLLSQFHCHNAHESVLKNIFREPYAS